MVGRTADRKRYQVVLMLSAHQNLFSASIFVPPQLSNGLESGSGVPDNGYCLPTCVGT